MRVHTIGITGILAAVCFGLAGCTPKKPDPVLEELKAIHATLNTITNQLAQQEAKREKVQSLSQRYNFLPPGGANMEKLAEIKLPDNPTPEQVKEYIKKIQNASEGQRSFSDRDPQIELYAAVGEKNLPLLIEALSSGPTGNLDSYHLIPAISQLAEDSDKSPILDALLENPDLIRVVQKKGWEKDARDILLSALKNGLQVSPDWIKAVAMLNDPESYPLLRDYFIQHNNRSWTYKAIADLPIKDMPGAVDEAWKLSQYEAGYERQQMALIAAQYGHVDALAYMIAELKMPPNQVSDYQKNETRLALLKLTGKLGTPDEMVAWYEANQLRLKFDPETKKFVVAPETPETEPEPSTEQ